MKQSSTPAARELRARRLARSKGLTISKDRTSGHYRLLKGNRCRTFESLETLEQNLNVVVDH